MAATRPSRRTKEAAMETMSQVTHTLRKRHDDGDEDDTLVEMSSEISRHEEDSDFEETSKAPVPPKPQKKRQTKKDAESVPPKKPRKAPEKAQTAPRRQPQTSEGDGSLYEAVKSGRSALMTIVDDWVESYKLDRDTALLELIQFFIQCSGCKGKITRQMYESMEHTEIIRKMTEEFDEENADYPLVMTGPVWKKFRANFCEFVVFLVRQCQYSIIYDQYMMDNLISFLTGLTDSQVRAFRHTSTMAAMKLMTALVDVALNLSVNLDNTQRQYDSERTKAKSKQAGDRLESLMNKRQELEENQEEIRNMLTYIFKGVFVHRYRDILADIRSICMQEIGLWMRKYPNMFLDDSYLKYVGWTLYDKQGSVRLDCLKCLSNLFEDEASASKMELFTNRFKDRIVELTLDKDYDVAVQAVKLVCSILRFNENILSDKDCENVYELVYSSHRAVAQAAGEFLNTKLFDKKDETSKSVKTKKGKKRSENTPLIRDLVQFFIESELHEHGAYLVDSLWDINNMMKDWECMTDLLVEEPGKGEETFDDRQEGSLIELMVCCIKQAATGESPVGRGPTTSKKTTSKEQRLIQEDKSRLTEHFIVILPELLAKYETDNEKIANLLQIPFYFDLEIYTTSRHDKHLGSLLNWLRDIVNKHTDSEILENCSKCYEVLCDQTYAIAGRCDTARSTLIDALTEKFKETTADYFQDEDPEDDLIFALHAALKRINAFYSCHDLTSWHLYDTLYGIVKAGNENNNFSWECVCSAIDGVKVGILWDLQSCDLNPADDACKTLKNHLKEFMETCSYLMNHVNDKVNETAYLTICDMLIFFNKHMAEGKIKLKALVYEPDHSLQKELQRFLEQKVFLEEDDCEEVDENIKIEELHNRRNLLASFAKLVVYNVVSIRCAVPMFKNYMKYYNDYGDIIKTTMGKAREINKVVTARTLATSLVQCFKDLRVTTGNQMDRSSDAFSHLKELGRRFSLSFGLDNLKNREAVAQIHKEGIKFSMTKDANEAGLPPNLGFLDVLCEFTGKLMKQDKRTVVAYLDKHLTDGLRSSRSEDVQPLLTYRNSLIQGDQDQSSVGSSRMNVGRPKGGRAKRKPIEVSVGDESTGDGTWMAKSTIATPAHMGHPQMMSTAIKKRRTDVEEPGSEAGSEADFQESSTPWTNKSHPESRMEPSYIRPGTRGPNVSRIEETMEEGMHSPAINEFSSPPQPAAPPSRRNPRLDPNLFNEEESPHITDADSELMAPAF